MKHTITLPSSKVVTLGTYVTAWRTLKTLAPERSVTGWASWGDDCSAATILRQIKEGVHERINRHLPHYNRGRKWSNDWYYLMHRTCRNLRTPRLRIHWLPHELRTRFAHRLADPCGY